MQVHAVLAFCQPAVFRVHSACQHVASRVHQDGSTSGEGYCSDGELIMPTARPQCLPPHWRRFISLSLGDDRPHTVEHCHHSSKQGTSMDHLMHMIVTALDSIAREQQYQHSHPEPHLPQTHKPGGDAIVRGVFVQDCTALRLQADVEQPAVGRDGRSARQARPTDSVLHVACDRVATAGAKALGQPPDWAHSQRLLAILQHQAQAMTTSLLLGPRRKAKHVSLAAQRVPCEYITHMHQHPRAVSNKHICALHLYIVGMCSAYFQPAFPASRSAH